MMRREKGNYAGRVACICMKSRLAVVPRSVRYDCVDMCIAKIKLLSSTSG